MKPRAHETSGPSYCGGLGTAGTDSGGGDCDVETVWRPPPAAPTDTLPRFARAFTERVDGAPRHLITTARASDADGGAVFDYDTLHDLSVRHTRDFYRTLIDFAGVQLIAPPADHVVAESAAPRADDASAAGANRTTEPLSGRRWLPGARINFAQNLLRNERARIVFRPEPGAARSDSGGMRRREISHAKLYRWVAAVAAVLRDQLGVGRGDHVVGYLPNVPETVVSMLATTSIGAVWSSCSPDFGTRAVLDRFEQVAPRVLIAADGYTFKTRRFDCVERVDEIRTALRLDAAHVLVVPFLDAAAQVRTRITARASLFPSDHRPMSSAFRVDASSSSSSGPPPSSSASASPPSLPPSPLPSSSFSPSPSTLPSTAPKSSSFSCSPSTLQSSSPASSSFSPSPSSIPPASAAAGAPSERARTVLPFTPISFDDPVCTMFSSGTTGRPKCMAQGPGILLTHVKEHLLHFDIQPASVVMFYTTCGWMMWNWAVSVLARGCTLVLYDGAPVLAEHDGAADVLWRIVNDEGVTHLGVSAKYLQVQEQLDVHPMPVPTLRTLMVTGSPSTPANFRYARRVLAPDAQYCSMSGGTDINGCFALGVPTRAVIAPEIQALALALDVCVFNARGERVLEEEGELVCCNAAPSMPLFFWPDNDPESMARYRASYFARFGDHVWHHGDFARISARRHSMVITGRSDATLNPGGVRFGSADIYAVVEAMPEVADSIVIGQAWRDDVRVVLFVQMAPARRARGIDAGGDGEVGADRRWRRQRDRDVANGGDQSASHAGADAAADALTTLDDALRQRIRKRIRDALSPRHVPTKIIAVRQIPYTSNSKKMEVAATRAANGRPVSNVGACANPEALNALYELPALRTD